MLVYLLFFLSGAAALAYEVAWVRSLGLIFGASHLAVATVLGVYMGGQALGSAALGARADRTERPLRLYGWLELGIAASALAFLGLMRVYPALYVPLARLAETSPGWLTALRVLFSVLALIVPTSLMGATLPVLARFVARRGEGFAERLSFLYAFNTLGAVAGASLTGFLLLRVFGVTRTLVIAAAVSAAVGLVALAAGRRPLPAEPPRPAASLRAPREDAATGRGRRLVLLGVGVSGFCALGYEVLWTRMLTLVVGTSAYSFTIMLVAFLAGLGLGSHAFGLLRGTRLAPRTGRGAVLLFAATQVAIGASALAASVLMRDLPAAAARVQGVLVGHAGAEFGGRLVASAGIALAYLFVPAFFMGLAFPAAGAAWSGGGGGERIGGAVGRLLGANTVGAVLGSSVTGFALVFLFGIERSLQLLVIVNVALGLAVAATVAAPRWAAPALGALAAALLVVRGALPDWGRAWDRDFFAAFTNNTRTYDTPETIKRKNIEVLLYREGANETVSVIRPRGSVQTFIVNGRPEASTYAGDVQVQRTLGHLPMLLHPAPRRVFVLGTGTAMTLGAVTVHPEAEVVVLGEIEEAMLDVARTFERWNDHALDSPKLRVVLNDGRNFLSTTKERFDVITADPIHPWSGGAGYLYTREYFQTVTDRLAPGGIACQWLPLYELTPRDVGTVLRTFSASFEHVLVWLTYYDAVLVGSQSPIVIDEAALARRLATPAIRDDLAPIHMASAEDFLSYFLMGTRGARAFGAGGALNTDDNLVLEFSAPESQGVMGLDGVNVAALSKHRERLDGYLAPAADASALEARRGRGPWDFEVARTFDRAHALFLQGQHHSAEVDGILASLRATAPGHAPLRFLLEEQAFWDRTTPALVQQADFAVRRADGAPAALRISAVRQFLGRERTLVSFVDNARREVYGQRYLDGPYDRLEGETAAYVARALEAFQLAAASLSPVPAEPELAAVLRAEAERLVGRLAEPR